MPPLTGQVIITLPDDAGQPAITVTWFFDPATRLLRNNPTPWTAPDGTVWAAGSGALIADNQLGREVQVHVTDNTGVTIRRVRIPAGGRRATATQLAAAPAPDGPYVVVEDLNGLSFDVS